MFVYKTNIGENGRIVIPARIRKKVNLSVGQAVVLNVENNEIKIIPYSTKLKNIENIVQSYNKNKASLVDKLTQMRKEELDNE